MKTKEELNALKNEVEALNKKLAELTEEELEQVTGGEGKEPCPKGLTEMVHCHDCLRCEHNEKHLIDEITTDHVCLLGYGSFRTRRTNPW